jgi:DNA processing protein
MVNEAVPVLQLMQTKGVGPRAFARVMDQLERDRLSLHEFVSLEPADIIERFGLKIDQASSIRGNKKPASDTAEKLEELGVRTILWNDAAYPARLTLTLQREAPPVLFVAGPTELLGRRGVGFCGARDASSEALRCAEDVARALVQHRLLVVSGHAQGVDETAHRSALEAGGETAIVLPEGILHFRPRASISEHLTEDNAVVISEFPPRVPWSVANAMQRNRTICGLVHALIVIEAGTSGGTWEAGQTALRLGVPLFVLDYSKPAPSGKGNALLLRKGGRPLPCSPGQPADLTLLFEAFDLPLPKTKAVQRSLFDGLETDK